MKDSTTVKGQISSFTVSGIDRNSAQLEIVVNGANVVVNSQPLKTDEGHEPQVFSAYAGLASVAYANKLSVEVQYVQRAGYNWVTSMRVFATWESTQAIRNPASEAVVGWLKVCFPAKSGQRNARIEPRSIQHLPAHFPRTFNAPHKIYPTGFTSRLNSIHPSHGSSCC